MKQHIKRMHGFFLYLYRHQFLRYLFVGGTTFLLNELVLITLHGFLKLLLPLSVFFSYVVSFTYNFMLNRWWAFSAAETATLKKHIKPYAMLFLFNLLFSIVFISTLSHFMHYAAATALFIALQTSWTFYIYKKYIFKNSRNSVEPAI